MHSHIRLCLIIQPWLYQIMCLRIVLLSTKVLLSCINVMMKPGYLQKTVQMTSNTFTPLSIKSPVHTHRVKSACSQTTCQFRSMNWETLPPSINLSTNAQPAQKSTYPASVAEMAWYPKTRRLRERLLHSHWGPFTAQRRSRRHPFTVSDGSGDAQTAARLVAMDGASQRERERCVCTKRRCEDKIRVITGLR